MRLVSFKVEGTPAPKGSMRAFKTRRGKVAVVHDNQETAPWAMRVGWAARAAMAGRKPVECGVQVRIAFYLPRPKSVKREDHTVKPDVDKLLRACLDAMTHIVWKDDAQVVVLTGHKHYADDVPAPEAHINVIALEDIE